MPGFNAPGAGAAAARIELQKRSQVPSATHDTASTFTTVASAWARVRTLFGARILAGVNEDQRATHVFTIRWRSDWRSDAWDFIEYDGRRFAVRSVEDPDERRTWLEVLAEEVRVGV